MKNILTAIRTLPPALLFLVAALFTVPRGAAASRLHDNLENRPYTDLRRWHLGFAVGLNTMDFSVTHNGFRTDEGRTWFAEQPDFSPGFTVNGLFNLRLNDYFALRLSPGIAFGNRVMHFRDAASGDRQHQDLKSAYLLMPVDLKYSAMRLRNIRPYLVGGLMPAADVLRKSGDFIATKTADCFATVGFGCDIYLPYFKLIPELKFCFGLTDVLRHDRPDLVDDPMRQGVSASFSKLTSQMVVLSFYFE